MSLPIASSLDDGIGLDINCQGCGRWTYLTPDEARSRDLGDLTFKQAAFRFRCEVCGAKGGPVIEVRFSIKDHYARGRDKGFLVPGMSKAPAEGNGGG